MTKRHSSANESTDLGLAALLLQEIKDQSSLTGQQISDATGVHPPMISRYLKSKTQPSLAKLAEMVHQMGYELAVYYEGQRLDFQPETVHTTESEVKVHSAEERIVATLLARIAEDKEMTKAEIHRDSDVSYSLVWNYMQANVQPSIPKLMNIIRSLNVKVEFAVLKAALTS